jgi:hypothetical protein
MDCENAHGKENKLKVAINLFNYMADEGYKICNNARFKQCVKDKVYEFKNEVGFFEGLKAETGEFIYALTGLHS